MRGCIETLPWHQTEAGYAPAIQHITSTPAQVKNKNHS